MAEIDIGLCGTQHISKNGCIMRLINDNRQDIINGEENNGICYDGVVDERGWKNSPVRLAFLLKETNGNNSDGKAPEEYSDWKTYMEWIAEFATRKTRIYPTFRNVAMWTSMLSDIVGGTEISPDKYLKNGQLQITEELSKSLLGIAVVNLKKTWGGGSTDFKTMDKYLESKTVREVIREELHFISPSVVLCGGSQVFYWAAKIYDARTDSFTTESGKQIGYFRVGDTLFVDFLHPACRKSRVASFNHAADVFALLKDLL